MRMRIISMALVATLVRATAALAAPAAWVEGDWIGGFEGRDGTVFISAHFTANGDHLEGRLDVPARGDQSVPLSRVDASERGLSFEVPGAQANLLFQGKRKDAGRVSGRIRQSVATAPFELIKVAALSAETLDAVSGNYEIEPGRVVLITRASEGLLYLDDRASRFGALFPIDQRTLVAGPSVVSGYPIDLTVTFAPGPDGVVDSIVWQDKGEPARRAVRRVYYRTAQIGFYNGAVRLSGTLVLPNTPGPHPAVVMIHGSGPVTRDGLRPWADMYARRGIAVLIHDKRGTGASTGNWARATFADLAGDALAGVAFLEGRPEINGSQIGVHGMSLGGWVAPLAAVRSPSVRFVIVESAPVLTPKAHERLRVEQQLRADGFKPDVVARAVGFMDQKFEVARTGRGWDRLAGAMTRATEEGWASYVNPPSSLESLQWNWEHVLSYDPLPALERMTCPVLVLYGGLDTIVPATHSSSRMEATLRNAGNRDTTVRVFERANHGFLQAVTGGKRENGSLRGFVAGYLDAHVEWLSARVAIPSAVPSPSVSATTSTAPASVNDSGAGFILAPRVVPLR
jgi:dienelactone hydrolase